MEKLAFGAKILPKECQIVSKKTWQDLHAHTNQMMQRVRQDAKSF